MYIYIYITIKSYILYILEYSYLYSKTNSSETNQRTKLEGAYIVIRIKVNIDKSEWLHW